MYFFRNNQITMTTSTSRTLHSKNANTRSNNNKSVFVTLQCFYYRVVGPTDAHLVHEFFLLGCLMLLTIAGMLSMYRYSFGETGDWSIVAATTLWLSRHVLLRIVCTSDGTSRRRWLRRVCGTNLTAGQYFDPPTRLHVTEAATFFAHVLTVLQHISSYTRFFFSYIPRSFVYIRNYYNSYLRSTTTTTTKLTPTTSTTNNNNNVMMPATNPSSSSLATATNTTPATTTATATAHQILNKYWNSIPPFQLVMATSVLLLCIATLFNFHANSSSLTGNPNTHSQSYYSYYMNSNSYGAARMRSMRAADHHHPNSNNHHPASTTTISAQLSNYVGCSATLNHFVGAVVGKRAWKHKPNTIDVGPFGFDSPTITQYLLCLTLWGTMASILVYGRLLLPIPDLASNRKHHHRNSGSNHNVNKSSDIRGNGGGGAKSNSNKGGLNTSSTNYSTLNNTNDIPWAEQEYKSINNENRFRLHCTVIMLRMIENVFVCLLLPQTPFACRVTAHCEPSSVIWGNDASIHTIATTTTTKDTMTSSSMYEALPPDLLSNFAIALSISTVTVVLLLAQALALDKSNLSLVVSTSQPRSYYDSQMMNTTTITSNTNNNNNAVVLSSSGGATFDGSNTNSKTNNSNSFSTSGLGGTSSQKRRNKGKGGVGSDAFNTWNMALGGSSSDLHHNSSGTTVRSGGIHSDASSTTRYYDVFQYELGHFSQSTVLMNLSTIQMICITLVSVCCVYRFLSNLNFLALSVALFANVLAAFAISGPSDTTELEQISEDIRSGLSMMNNELEDTTAKSGSSPRAKKK